MLIMNNDEELKMKDQGLYILNKNPKYIKIEGVLFSPRKFISFHEIREVIKKTKNSKVKIEIFTH